ncbi:hypothetical protein ACHAP4_011649 [Fusarium culmorum]
MAIREKPGQDINVVHHEGAANSTSDKEMASDPPDTVLVGRRWVAIGSGILGVVGAVIGATAKKVPTVIAAMTIIGVAAGGCLNSHPAICELVPTRARGNTLGVVNLVTSMWSVFGSLFAFHMADKYGWRSVFWVALAIHATGSILCFIFYKPSEPLALDGKTRMQVLHEFDWIGLAGLMTGPTLILLGISWLGDGYGSKDAHFIAPLITGIVTCIALGFYEAYIPQSPILHPHLFKMVRSFTIVLVLVFVGGMLFYSLQSLYPVYVQALFTGPNPTKIGLWSVCLGAGTTLGGVSSGFLITKLKSTRLMLLFGIFIMAVFIALMAVPKPGDNSMALAFSFFGGIGIGWEQTLAILVIQLACPNEWIGFANGILGLFRICGGAAGTAIYSTVLSTQTRKYLPKLIAQAAVGAGLPPTSLEDFMTTFLGRDPSAAAQLPGVNAAVMKAAAEAAKLAYYKSFRLVWLVTIPFGVAGIIAALVTADQSHKLVDSTAITLKAEEKAATQSGRK